MALLAGSGLNLLAVNPGLMIWTLITFLIVLTILWFFAWKPIATALDSRSDKIESDLQKSQELREEAEQLLADYKAKLDSAKEEAAQLIEQARKTAEEQKTRSLKKQESKLKLRSNALSRILNKLSSLQLMTWRTTWLTQQLRCSPGLWVLMLMPALIKLSFRMR